MRVDLACVQPTRQWGRDAGGQATREPERRDGRDGDRRLLGLDGKAGLMGRAERVVLLAAVILLSPFGALPWGIAVLAALTTFTVVQRILSVQRQLVSAAAEKGSTL